ncbi:MAG: oxidoreductase [Gammaproteobacteria bacterium]|nr:oxidoreductase [Gammaproteobacteria bacterium]
MSSIVLFGATGKTGLALSKVISGKNLEFFAAVRPGRKSGLLESLGAKILIVDALDQDKVHTALKDLNKDSIIVSLVGGRHPKLGTRIDYPANKNIIETSAKLGFSRFIFITSIGSGESKPQLPKVLKPILGSIADEKTKAENILRASGLGYTIIRPGQLTNEEASGDGVLTEERILGTMSREDLALMIMRCIEDEETIGKIYSVLDSNKKLDLSWVNKR